MTTDPRSAAEIHKNVPPNWYDQSIRENIFQRFWHRKRFEAIGRLIEPSGGEILDIGCADGVFTHVILERSHAQKIIGIDVLANSVAWAQDHWRHLPALEFRLGDAHVLEFPDQHFDAVFCLEALEHVHNPLTVLKEMRRVMKPNGYGIILVPSDNLLFRIIWYLWTRFSRGRIWQECHLQSFQGHSLASVVLQAGFIIEQEYPFLLGMLMAIKFRKGAAPQD